MTVNPVGYCIYVGQQQERERIVKYLNTWRGITHRVDVAEVLEQIADDLTEERHCE